MPQVPYQPTTQVAPAPAGAGSTGIHVAEPPDAFGVGIAQAWSHLGKTVEGAADEMWKKAVQLQEMQNASDARVAGAAASQEMNLAHAKYGALQGKDATDALPDHLKELEDIRQKHRATLTNPMAQQHYDSDSYPMLNRTTFSAAAHSARAAKQYATGSAKAENDVAIDTVRHYPDDDSTEKAAIDTIMRNANAETELGHLQGPMKELVIKAGVSKVRLAKVEALAKDSPQKAEEYYNAHEKEFYGGDYDRATTVVKTALYDVQTRVEGGKITDWMKTAKEGEVEKTEKDMLEEARKSAAKQRPNDPVYEERLINTVRGQIRLNKEVKRDDLLRNREIIQEALQRTDAKSMDDLMKDPAAAEARKSLPSGEQNDLHGKINRYQAAKNKPDEDANMRRIMGLRINDPAAFADIDSTKEKLSQTQMQTVSGWQRADRKKPPQEFAKTRQAIGWLVDYNGQRMTALNLDKRTENNKDEYDEFAGHIFDQLNAWKDLKGHYPSQKEFIEHIGDPLLKAKSKKGVFWGTNEYPTYKQEVPEEFKNWLTQVARGKGASDPTDRDAAIAWSRTLLLKREEDRALGKRRPAIGE